MRVKKCFIRWLLSATMLFSMAEFSVVADSKTVDLMPSSQDAVKADTSVSGNYAGSYKYENGKLTVDSVGADGYRVVIDVNKDIAYEDLRSLFVKVSCNVDFNIAFTDSNDKWHGLASDWYPSFGQGSTDKVIVGGDYNVELDFYNAVTFNPDNIPADHIYHAKQLFIAVKKPGTLTLSKFEVGAATTKTSGTAAATTTKGKTSTTTKAGDTSSIATSAVSSADTTTSEISTTATVISSTTNTTTTTQVIIAAEGKTNNKFPWAAVIIIVAVVVIGGGIAAFFIIKKKKQEAN